MREVMLSRLAPRAVMERLRGRPDTEHEMVINRVVIAVVIVSYLLFSSLHHPSVREPLMVALVFAAFAAGFLIDILARPGESRVRRVMAMSVDLGALSYGMHVGEGITALLYPMYLWTIFGNGFRFGLRYLLIAAVMSVVGFGVVVYMTEYWRENLALGIGLLLGLIILPLYAATLIRKLSEARRVAEEASRSKSLFLASVSHELRTPLNAVIGMSDLLRDTRLDAEQRDMASTIRMSARALLTLIEEILDYSRLDAGRMPMECVDFDLHNALSEVAGMVKAQALAKNILLGLNVTPRTPYSVRGDRKHLQEILINLAGNAVKFTDSGHVLIAVDVVSSNGSAKRLRFEVSDTGIGIAPEATERIFESFTQADETIINRYGGTGLGLAICRKLAEALGGAIGVVSEVGRGSTFWLELPFEELSSEGEAAPLDGLRIVLLSDDDVLREDVETALPGYQVERGRDWLEGGTRPDPEDDRATLLLADGGGRDCDGMARALAAKIGRGVSLALVDTTAEPSRLSDERRCLYRTALGRPVDRAGLAAAANMALGERSGPDQAAGEADKGRVRPLSILVADDNGVNRQVISKILEHGGHRVKLAVNGEEAMDMMMAGGVDLVLMDVNMPVMSGIEATKLYRFASLGRDRLPIIALTADATPDAAASCMEAGMDAVLSKPIERAELFAALKTFGGEPDEAPAEAPRSDAVTDIAAHPKFRGDARSVIEASTIADLEALGGRAFIDELVENFVEEGNRIMAEIGEAVADNDATRFRDRLHALRSGAANIGARALYEVCLAHRAISAEELAASGSERGMEVESEFRRAEAALAAIRRDGSETPSAPTAKIAEFPRKQSG